jgi:hypothetical protein
VSTAKLFAGNAYDPSAAGAIVAWQRPNGVALISRGGEVDGLPGSHPAVAGTRIAWQEGAQVVTADAATLASRKRHDAPEAGVLALSDTLLAWRTRDAAGTDRLWVRPLAPPGDARLLLESPAPAEIGRPAVAGGQVLCHLAGPGGSQLLGIDAATGARQLLRAEPGAQITNPATDGSRLLYVHATGRAQELRLGELAPADPADDRVLLVYPSSGARDREHEHGRRRHRQGYPNHRPRPLPPRAARGVVDTLWSTALSGDTAYFTRLRASQGLPRSGDILRVPAPP